MKCIQSLLCTVLDDRFGLWFVHVCEPLFLSVFVFSCVCMRIRYTLKMSKHKNVFKSHSFCFSGLTAMLRITIFHGIARCMQEQKRHGVGVSAIHVNALLHRRFYFSTSIISTDILWARLHKFPADSSVYLFDSSSSSSFFSASTNLRFAQIYWAFFSI